MTDWAEMKKQAMDELNNESTVSLFFSNNMDKRAQATDVASKYLRAEAREDIIWYGLMTPIPTTKDDLDTQVAIDDPCVVFLREPFTPAPLSVPFGGQAPAVEIMGNKGVVVMSPIESELMRANKWQLLNNKSNSSRMDIREVLTKNIRLDIGAKIDAKGFSMVDTQLGGSADTTVSEAGTALWKTISGGFTPNTWVQFLSILPDADQQFGTATVVLNRSLSLKFLAWKSFDLSDSVLEKLRRRGWVEDEINGVRLIITIKNDVVPNNRMYGFVEEESLGQTNVLEDVTMFPEAHKNNLEWQSQTIMGSAVQGIGCCSATLSGV